MNMSAGGVVAGAIAGIVAVTLMLRGIFTEGLPVVALALWERALRVMPMELFGFLIVRLKFLAKPLAFWGMLGGMVAGWALLGLLLGRAPWMRRRAVTPRAFVLSLLATVVLAFVLTFVPLVALTFGPATVSLSSRLEAAGIALSPVALARQVLLALAGYAGIFALTFTVLAVALSTSRKDGRGEPAPAKGAPAGGADLTRREVLRRSLAIGAGLLLGSALARWAAALGQRTIVYAQTLFDRIRGLPAEITPNKEFYVVSKNPPGFDPVVDGRKWSLEITGLVGKPVKFTYEEIRAMPQVTQVHTLECISNELGGDLISNARWRGVRLRDVLARAGGVSAKAIKIAFRCADGYTESIPVADAMHADTLLVYEMNGEPLPPSHGFPVRLLVPGLFGMKNPKWITRIEAVNYDFQGYWERSGWSDEAVVKTMSKFTAPGRQALRAGEKVGLGGVAYAGDRGVRAVEVSTDDGRTWQPAQLKPPLGKYTWVLWAALWTPTGPGEYTLKVRARDGGGVVQTAQPTPTLPEGATGHHAIRLRVRT